MNFIETVSYKLQTKVYLCCGRAKIDGMLHPLCFWP